MIIILFAMITFMAPLFAQETRANPLSIEGKEMPWLLLLWVQIYLVP